MSMTGSRLSSSPPSNDIVEIIRKLHTVGYFSDLSIPEPDPQKISSAFNRILILFQNEIRRKREIRPVPVMLGDGQIVDLFKLYFAVRERGGYESVTAQTGWPAVSEAIGFDSGRGPAVKLVYVKYLGALERWLELVLAKKETLSSAAIVGELRAEVTGLCQNVLDHSKNEEEGRQTPNSGSKKNHFLTTVRDDGRRLKPDDDEKGIEDKDSGGDDEDNDVVIIQPEDAKREVARREVVSPKELGSGYKRKRDALVGMLDWVLKVAKDPGDVVVGKVLPSSDCGNENGNFMVGELYSQALSARQAMFLKRIWKKDSDTPSLQNVPRLSYSLSEDHTDAGSLPSEKPRQSQRLGFVNKQSNTVPGAVASINPETDVNKSAPGEEANTCKKKMRKSSLLSELDDIMSRLLPKDIRYEAAKKFNTAVVPQWTDNPSSTPYNSDDLKWLGTPVWPLESREGYRPFKEDAIGKGRQNSCRCKLPGSVECTRLHVTERRVQLRRELGPAFHRWRFDSMGEEVSLSWTEEEAQRFKSIVRQNLPSTGEKFWDHLRQSFPSKGMKNLVRYYFNVFLLARRSYQNRVTPGSIDSDDEEPEFGFLSVPFGHDAVNVPAPKSNLCIQNAQCIDIDD